MMTESRKKRHGDEITLGFDGSRKRHHATTDATALVGCRVFDGHVFIPFGSTIWEAPAGPEGKGWEAPAAEIDVAVRAALESYNVVGFYCDPNKWESFVAAWEGEYGASVRVKASSQHPFTWWPSEKRITEAVDRFHTAIVSSELTHDGNSVLRRHVLNARRRPTNWGISIRKEHPSSGRKIDAAIAAVLAWQARLDAVAQPVARQRRGVVW